MDTNYNTFDNLIQSFTHHNISDIRNIKDKFIKYRDFLNSPVFPKSADRINSQLNKNNYDKKKIFSTVVDFIIKTIPENFAKRIENTTVVTRILVESYEERWSDRVYPGINVYIIFSIIKGKVSEDYYTGCRITKNYKIQIIDNTDHRLVGADSETLSPINTYISSSIYFKTYIPYNFDVTFVLDSPGLGNTGNGENDRVFIPITKKDLENNNISNISDLAIDNEQNSYNIIANLLDQELRFNEKYI